MTGADSPAGGPGRCEGRAVLSAVGISMTVPSAGGPRHLLEDFCLDLAAGEMIAVTGRTGAGKSTLLRILAGFLLPQEGID